MRHVSWMPAAAALLLVSMATAEAQGLKWMIVNWKVRHEFPRVKRISPDELAAWLEDPQRPRPVLLDVRTKAEFNVSHLRGARRVEPGSDKVPEDIAPDQPIVTYCSVGYRSGTYAQTLQKAGFRNVRNMSGSIFAWANAGYPVFQDGRQVHKVHPYNERWGSLLKKPLRADVPAAGSGL